MCVYKSIVIIKNRNIYKLIGATYHSGLGAISARFSLLESRNGRMFPLINFDTLRAPRFPANDLNRLPANIRGRLPL